MNTLTINTRQDLINAVDTALMFTSTLPDHAVPVMVDVKARFRLVNPSKGLYWKETPNGILSVNSDSIVFLKSDGTKAEVFSQGLEEALEERTWLYMYCLIWPLQSLREDSFLMKWLEEHYQVI